MHKAPEPEIACRELLTNPHSCKIMSKAQNPYGDGQASRRIRKILEQG